MNQDQNRRYFEELTKIQSEKANSLQKPLFTGMQANIIYELLQNADDCQATTAIFDLYQDKLVFKHNGKRHFTISDPSNDKDGNNIGDINSITSISNYYQIEQKVGKFGVGFKSVFQYTITPYIYDINFCFRIDQFVIPVLITEDYADRESDETIFVLPFNHPEKSAKESFNEISSFLSNLNLPNLFLNTLIQIYFTIENQLNGSIKKNIQSTYIYKNNKADLTEIESLIGRSQKTIRIWIISPLNNSNSISVGFLVDSRGELIPAQNQCAYCFFKTSEVTNLNFLINGPFLLSDDRLRIKNNAHNNALINDLANLASESLMLFKNLGIEYDYQFLNEKILHIIPTDEKNESESYRLFFNSIQKVFLNEEIIPCHNGYVLKKNAFWTSEKKYLQLISNEQLTVLTSNSDAKWVFKTFQEERTIKANSPNNSQNTKNMFGFQLKAINVPTNVKMPIFGWSSSATGQSSSPNNQFGWGVGGSAWGQSIQNNSTQQNQAQTPKPFVSFGEKKNLDEIQNSIISYIQKIINTKITDDNFITKQEKHGQSTFKILSLNVNDFIEKQDFEWLTKFYKMIDNDNSLFEKIKEVPIFLNKNGQACKYSQLFFPYPNGDDKSTVHPKLIEDKTSLHFMRKIGISVPLNNEIFQVIIPKYKSNTYFDAFQYFSEIFFFYKYCSLNELDNLINELKKVNFLMFVNNGSKLIDRGIASNLYFPYDFLIDYFENKPQICFLLYEKYKEMIDQNDEQKLVEFMIKLGVKSDIQIINKKLAKSEIIKNKIQIFNNQDMFDYCFEDFDSFFDSIPKNPSKSFSLWNLLLNTAKKSGFDCFYSSCKDCSYKFPSVFRNKLMNNKWILTFRNEFVASNEVFLNELNENYNVDDPSASILIDFLDIKKRNVKLLTDEYVNDHCFVQRLKNLGLYEKVEMEMNEKEKLLKTNE